MDLLGDIFEVRTRGRAASPVAGVVVRELEPADLEALVTEPRGTKAPPLKRISERHHALARNLAAGMSKTDAAFITGYDVSRISILLDDPTFGELIQFYRADVDRTYSDLHQRLAGLAVDAADVLSARLEETPEEVSIGQLIEITKMGADRTGHGPSSTQQVNVNVGIAAKLEEARKRIAARTIDLKPIEDIANGNIIEE